jgi:NDP-sugar pyrophosphorylase family protein
MTELMPAIILAGGYATRLGTIAERIPKALIDIAGRPFIWHQLRLLKRNGIGRVVLAVGHLGEMIEECIGNGQDLELSIEYSYDGPSLLGTGGAIRKALPLLPESFFVLYGDSYLTCDYAAVESAFRARAFPALMTIYRNDGLFDSSNVEYDGTDIVRYDKKNRTPAMHYIDYGLGAFRRQVFQSCEDRGAFDLAELYQSLADARQLGSFEVNERFYEIGSPAGLRDTIGVLTRPDFSGGGP